MRGELTGTLEEFQIALQRYGEIDPYFPPEDNRPMLYVYFREQTEPDSSVSTKCVLLLRYKLKPGASQQFRKLLKDVLEVHQGTGLPRVHATYLPPSKNKNAAEILLHLAL